MVVPKHAHIKSEDIHQTAFLCGVTHNELIRYLGMPIAVWNGIIDIREQKKTATKPATPARKRKQITTNDALYCIIIRYLKLQPTEVLESKMFPRLTVYDVQAFLAEQDINLRVSELAGLFGRSAPTGRTWETKKNKTLNNKPPLVLERAFELLVNAVNKNGKKGYEEWLTCVQQEAIVRGQKNVIKNGWSKTVYL